MAGRLAAAFTPKAAGVKPEVGRLAAAFLGAAKATGNVVPVEVGEGVDPEVAAQLEYREVLRTRLANAAAEASYKPTGGGRGKPAAALSGGVRSAVHEATRRGLTPEGVVSGAPEEVQEPTLGEKIGSFLGSIPITAAVGSIPGIGPAAAALGGADYLQRKAEDVMGLGRAVPPGGRTVQRPTVVSTAFDILQTSQRVGVVAPLESALGDREAKVSRTGKVIQPAERWWQTMGTAFKLPSWSGGAEPRDMTAMTRRALRELGYDADSWLSTAVVIASNFADPIMLLGGARTEPAKVAAEQAVRIGRRALASMGVRGQPLEQQSAALAAQVSAAIKESGDLGAARPVVRGLLDDLVGPPASSAFDRLGTSWSQEGLLLHIPGLGGRGRFQVEAVSHQTLREQSGGVRGALAGTMAGGLAGGLPGAVLGGAAGAGVGKLAPRLPGAQAVADLLAAARRPLDPSAPPKGVAADDMWWHDYYRQRVAAGHIPEHIARVETARIAEIAPHATTARKGVTDPAFLSTGELARWSADPKKAAEAEREWALAVFNYPTRASTEHWAPSQYAEAAGAVGDGALLPSVDLTGGKLLDWHDPASRVIRQGFADAVIAGQKKGLEAPEATARFGDYVAKGLVAEGWGEEAASAVAVDILPRAEQALAAKIPGYRAAWSGLESRLQNLVKKVHEGTENRLWAEREAVVAPHAKRMAAGAAAEAKANAIAAGKDAKEASKAAAAAATQVHADIMARLGAKIDNHFTHIVRNREAIRRRIPEVAPPGAPKFTKHREFVDVIENYEHGQDPVTDLLVTTAASAEAHAKVMGQWEVARIISTDRRWAVPLKESAGLRAKGGWQEWAHPITDERYAVRDAVAKDYQRLIEGYDPKGLDLLFRTVAHAAPWLGTPLAGWKARVTHGRPLYHLRNLPDDIFRMWMGGYDGSPETAKEAVKVALMGHLEVATEMRPAVRAVRRPAVGVAGKVREYADRLQDAFDGHLRKMATEELVQDGTGERLTRKAFYGEMARRGVVDKGFSGHDLGSPMDVQKKTRRWSPLDLGWKDFNPLHREHVVFGEGGFFLKLTGNIARKSENIRRMTAALSSWKRGNTLDEAAHTARKWLIDYDELTDAERAWLRPVFSFYTFSRKVIPRHWEGLKKHPGRYLAPAKVGKGLSEKAESEQGPQAAVAPYIEDAEAVRVPSSLGKLFSGDAGDNVFLSTGLSSSELNLLNPLMPMQERGGRGGFYDEVSPIFDVAALMLTGREPRTGRYLPAAWSEPDQTLLALVKGWNATAGLTDAFKVPVLEKRTRAGAPYTVLPATLVWTYNKWLPNVISFSQLYGKGRHDPFEENLQRLRAVRQGTGLGVYLNNPLQAEVQKMQQLLGEIQPAVQGP